MSKHPDPLLSQNNTDKTEIEKFNSLANYWWDTKGKFRSLHAINPLRLSWISQEVGEIAGKKILDVGCGAGILSEALVSKGARVTGIDPAEEVLKIAELHGLESGVDIEYRSSSIEELAMHDSEKYDVVICMEVLEHVPDPFSVVYACSKLVKQNGWVLFSTLNRNFKSFLSAIIGAEYILRLVPISTHSYKKFIKPSELSCAMRYAELHLVGIRGLSYNPFNQTYSLSHDVSVNYFMSARRLM